MLVNMFKEAFMHSKIFSVLRTLLLSVAISLAAICLLALLMWKLQLSTGQVRIGLYAAYLLSCLFGGFCIGHIFPQKRILWGLGFGVIYFLLLVLFCAVFGGPGFAITAAMLLPLGLCLTGSAAGAFFS